MSKKLANLYAYIEDERTSIAELREVRAKLAKLIIDARKNNDSNTFVRLCAKMVVAVDEELLVREILK